MLQPFLHDFGYSQLGTLIQDYSQLETLIRDYSQSENLIRDHKQQSTKVIALDELDKVRKIHNLDLVGTCCCPI